MTDSTNHISCSYNKKYIILGSLLFFASTVTLVLDLFYYGGDTKLLDIKFRSPYFDLAFDLIGMSCGIFFLIESKEPRRESIYA